MSDARYFLELATGLAEQNVRQGGRPFGAVVVKNGRVIARGINRMQADCDPTAHAEMLALRAAGKALRSDRLDGCEVYASGQPCPMCLAAMRLCGISSVVYAISNQQAEPFGLSTQALAEELARPLTAQSWAEIRHMPLEESPALYSLWQIGNNHHE